VAGRAETLEVIHNLLAGATIFVSSCYELLDAELDAVADHQVTFTQLRLLRLVAHQVSLTIGDVAEFLGISNAAASKAVDRLVRAGFLRRAESADDRRATEVWVTEEGTALLERFDAGSSEMLLKVMAGCDLHHLRELTTGLDRLSVSLVGAQDQARIACFRCGLYFRGDCLLRALTDRRCYLDLGAALEDKESPLRPRRRPGDRAAATTEGNG